MSSWELFVLGNFSRGGGVILHGGMSQRNCPGYISRSPCKIASLYV